MSIRNHRELVTADDTWRPTQTDCDHEDKNSWLITCEGFNVCADIKMLIAITFKTLIEGKLSLCTCKIELRLKKSLDPSVASNSGLFTVLYFYKMRWVQLKKKRSRLEAEGDTHTHTHTHTMCPLWDKFSWNMLERHTSIVDWCEENYATSGYIAEFWNSVWAFTCNGFLAEDIGSNIYFIKAKNSRYASEE